MGPLQGVRVIELGGIGPCPMAGMMLADMGAEVTRIERSASMTPNRDVSLRGKLSIALNLKVPAAVATVLRLLQNADAIIEGFRPGVTERLGLGPEVCLGRNPKLVYGRVTGWGQSGPLAETPGHDINYIALTGALHAIGRAGDRPAPPLNLVGDMGAGGMLLALGVVCALFEAKNSGRGQVVDAAMIDGTAQLMWMMHSLHARGLWNASDRGTNLLDGGAHFYDVYETSDHKYVAVGAIEPEFYSRLIELTRVNRERFSAQLDSRRWPELKAELAQVFKTKTRAEWCGILEGTAACFAPVLTLEEAPHHPHNRARQTYTNIDGVSQHSPTPRFSRTAPQIRHAARSAGADSEALLGAAGFSAEEIRALREQGALLTPGDKSPAA